METNCEDGCKFCIIHKYGVYVLGGGSLVVVILILVYFWRYLCYCCVKPDELKENPGFMLPPDSNTNQQQIAGIMTLNEKSLPAQAFVQELTRPKTRDHSTVIDRSLRHPSPVPSQSPNYIPPPMSFNSPSAFALQLDQPIFPQQLPPDFSNLPFSPQPTTNNKGKTKNVKQQTKTKGFQATAPIPPSNANYQAMSPLEQQQQQQQQLQQQQQQQPTTKKRSKPMIPVEPVGSPDPFKLPQPAITSKESTGSNYFKQMFQGRKPVASISQYNNLRKKNKKHKTHQEKTKNKDKK